MILRDPVHGLVSFEGDDERLLTKLLGTFELQRLRQIRQLGLASLVFPGAEHSRFSHAVGTAYVMTKLLRRFRECEHELRPEHRLSSQDRLDALAAACLHDIGHGPLSHLFEDVLAATPHEEWTYAAILDPATDVHRALTSFDRDMPARVVDLLKGRHAQPYLARSVSGTLDVDRCDYLLRDSHMTGATYGVFDLDWLIRSLKAHETGEGVVLCIEGRKGLPPMEGFFLARHFMYQQVYQHKAVRAAECLVRGIFLRMRELVQTGVALEPMPASLRASVLGEAVKREDYYALDDHGFWACVYAWQNHDDRELATMCGNLRLRNLPKTLPLPEGDEHAELRDEVWRRACDVAAQHAMRPALHVWLDIAQDVPYAETRTSDTLWVFRKHRPLLPLGDVSFLLSHLRNQRVQAARLVFSPELRGPVLAAVEGILRAA